jgi:hypothetical protein
MQMKTRSPLSIGWLLNLLVPGLGHIYVREYSFGLFIFLITLLGVVLFAASFFVDLSGGAILLLLGLPALFYLFTFFDLWRTVRARGAGARRASRAAIWFLLIGLIYQAFAPTAVGNLIWRNRPVWFAQQGSQLSPLYSTGEWLKASRMSYRLDVGVIRKPILHHLPDRYDLVLFATEDGLRAMGVVVGMPLEQVEIVSGAVVVNGMIDYDAMPLGVPLVGYCELTSAGDFSILVATFRLGLVENMVDVRLDRVIGKVTKAP